MKSTNFIVNMNVNLRNGGRKAVTMSEEDFETMLGILASELDCGCVGDGYEFIPELIRRVPSIDKDIKVIFGTENVEVSYERTSNGVPYLLCECGCDYETPVVFMIYHDGKKFRAYVPTKGNMFNRDTKWALGNDNAKDYKFLCKEFGKKTVDGLIDDPDDIMSFIEELQSSVRACKKDFESRLTITGHFELIDEDELEDEREEEKYLRSLGLLVG